MSEEDRFQQILWNNPDDDLACLIYADCLEEWGQTALAEFLRLECQLRQLSADDPKLLDLMYRRIELFRSLPLPWLAQYHRYTDVDFWHWSQMHRHSPLASPPAVCRLSRCRNIQAVQRHTSWTRQKALYRTLEFDILPAPACWQGLQQIPELGDFDILIINLLTDEGRRVRFVLEALTHFPAPVRWKTLVLNCHHLTTEIVEMLRDAPAWQGLRHLHLRVFQTSGLEEPRLWPGLYQSPWFSHLRGLRLQLPSPRAYQALVTYAPWPNLQWLEWDLRDLLPPAPAQSVNISMPELSQAFPNLRGLRIWGNLVDAPSGRETLNGWSHLRFLDWRGRGNGNVLLDALHNPSVFAQLWELSLWLPSDSLRLLIPVLRQRHWPALQSLSLHSPVITVRLLHALRSHPDLQKLRYLRLTSAGTSQVGTRDLLAFLRHCSLPHLLHLSLGGLRVHPAMDKAALLRYLPQLRLLDLQDCLLLGKRPSPRRSPSFAQSHPLILWP